MTRSLSNFYQGSYAIRGREVCRVIDTNDRIARTMEKIEREQEKARIEEFTRLREEAIENGTIDEHPEFKEGIFAEEIAPEEPQIDMVAQAKEEAAQILEAAQTQASQIHMQAVEEAERLRMQSKEEGYREGKEAAKKEAAERERIQQETFEKKELALHEQYEKALSSLEPQLLDTMLTIFDDVFGMQFRGKQELLLQLVRHAMRGIRETKHIKIHVCEEEAPFLREHKAELIEKVGEDVVIEIVMDPKLTSSCCILDTDSGVYDCSLDVALDQLTRDLKSLCVCCEQ